MMASTQGRSQRSRPWAVLITPLGTEIILNFKLRKTGIPSNPKLTPQLAILF